MNTATTVEVASRRMRLGERLVFEGLVTEQQLQQGLERQEQSGCFLGEALVALGFVGPGELGRRLEETTGFNYVDLSEYPIEFAVARRIPERIARRKAALPIADNGDEILVAMCDPLDLATVDDFRARLNSRIVPMLTFEPDLHDALNRAFDVGSKAESVLEEMADTPSMQPDLSVDELLGLAEDAPIVRLVNGILTGAIAQGASDIHIEPQESESRVRYRMDGLLYDQMTIPSHHLAAVVSRIKVISHLNIAERRRSQDGRFAYRDDKRREFDLRVSIMPTIYGEKVVMRVLEKSGTLAFTDKLGFYPEQQSAFERFIRYPHGIVLVTGPTGSGKSTTLYSALNQINNSTLNINTIEDPVEYHLKGINQVQVNPKIGASFANGLRTLVRQDPDVIMVGEIRDLETAEIAIQAALTGHLVLSSLHTNDAPGALVRLQNMGVEPFLISSAVIGVIGQRLLRTLCPHCKETRPASPATMEVLGLPQRDDQVPILATGRGCKKCGMRGMKGRTAVYEVMPMTDSLRDMVLQRRSGAELKGQAISEGMSTMRESAVRKVLDGITTSEELARVLLREEN